MMTHACARASAAIRESLPTSQRASVGLVNYRKPRVFFDWGLSPVAELVGARTFERLYRAAMAEAMASGQ